MRDNNCKQVNPLSRKEGDFMNNNSAVRMRTIPKAYEEIKRLDPDTKLSTRAFRRMVSGGVIPSVTIDNVVLVNLDRVLEILSCGRYNLK